MRITLPALTVTVSTHAGEKHCSSWRKLALTESAFASYSSTDPPAFSTNVTLLADTISMTAPGCNGDGGGGNGSEEDGGGGDRGGEGGGSGDGGGESGRIGGPSGCNGGGGEHGGGNVDPQAQQLSSGWLYPAGSYDVSSAHSIPGQAPWPWPQHQPRLTYSAQSSPDAPLNQLGVSLHVTGVKGGEGGEG